MVCRATLIKVKFGVPKQVWQKLPNSWVAGIYVTSVMPKAPRKLQKNKTKKPTMGQTYVGNGYQQSRESTTLAAATWPFVS